MPVTNFFRFHETLEDIKKGVVEATGGCLRWKVRQFDWGKIGMSVLITVSF